MTLTSKIGTQTFRIRLQVIVIHLHTKSFIKKVSAVQKLSSRQLFPDDLPPYCDLDLEDSNLKLLCNTAARDDAPLYQIRLQKVEKFRRYGRNSVCFKDLSPHCDLDLEDRNPTFPHDTLGRDDAPSHQVW